MSKGEISTDRTVKFNDVYGDMFFVSRNYDRDCVVVSATENDGKSIELVEMVLNAEKLDMFIKTLQEYRKLI